MVAGSGNAQEPTELYIEISRLDAAFFAAFNACDQETTEGMFAEDLEFFHDIGGLSDKAQTLEAGKSNCERALGLERELVEGSLEVYPIKDYGAIQKGKHTFCHLENGKNDCGTFEFVHIWRKSEGGWQMTRVISYGH